MKKPSNSGKSISPRWGTSSKSTHPSVGILILNWNQWPLTVECLRALETIDYSNFEALVVDNGSMDDSVTHLREAFPDLQILQNEKNTGFTGGVNRGVDHFLATTTVKYVFLLNNDALMDKDALTHIVEIAEREDSAIVGGCTLDGEGKDYIFTGRRWPGDLFLGPWKTVTPLADLDWWPTARVDGSAMLIRRDLLETRINEQGFALDPRYFFYCEETDLCRYAVSRGHKCLIAGKALVHHDVAVSVGGQGNPTSFYYQTRNRVFLAERWLSFPWKLLFHLYYAPSRIVLHLIRWRRYNGAVKKAVFWGLIHAYTDVVGEWPPK